jgi:hypothetical protein
MTTRDRLVKRGAINAALVLALLAGGPVRAQNMISQDGWEGFAMRDTDNKFDRCALYNRSIQALTASPYQMFGITRDAAGRIGLLIFYEPRMLTRGNATVRLKLDQRPPVSVAGTVLSDFHVNVPALEPATVAALRDTKAIDATVADHTIHFDLAEVGAALDRLDACVKSYGPKS